MKVSRNRLWKKPPVARVIKTTPRHQSPITFDVGVLGLDHDLIYDKVRKAWLNPNCLRYEYHHKLNAFYIEFLLPRMYFTVEVQFQGDVILTAEPSNEEVIYYAPIGWAATVVSGVAYSEDGLDCAPQFFKDNGFVVRQGRELW